MKKIILLTLTTILSSAVYAEDNAPTTNELLGKWNFDTATTQMPKQCTKSYMNFVDDSKMLGSDGARTFEVKYTLEKSEKGYTMTTTEVSNDGKPNCIGMDMPRTDKPLTDTVFFTLSEDKESITFHRGPQYNFTYKKEKAEPATETQGSM